MAEVVDESFAEILAEGIRSRVRRVRDALAKVRLAADGESTHALATSLRRLAVADFVVASLYGRHLLGKHKDRIRKLRKTLGRIRDILEIRKKFDALKLNTPFAHAFAAELDAEGRREDERVTRSAKRLGEDFLRKLEKKREARRLCRGVPEHSSDYLRRHLLERVLALREEALERRDDEALHRLRVRYKRYRYAVELMTPSGEKADAERLAYLRTLQEAMGQAHDWMVLEDELRAFSEAQPLAGVRAVLAVARTRRVQAHREARRYVAAELKTLARREGIV